MHHAEITATDLSGNVARRTISFFVERDANDMELTLSSKASAESVEINVEGLPEEFEKAELVVTDNSRKPLYRKTVASFPTEWNLTDDNGTRLAPGDYNINAIIDGAGTAAKKIVVLKQ